VVASVAGEGDVAKSQTVVSSALQANPTAIGIYAFNDEGAAGAINAVKAAGKNPAKYCIVTLGGSDQSAASVVDGSLYALTALQFGDDLAQTVDTLIAMAADPTAVGKQLTTPIKTSITTVK
jgi:ABC-type sugar transport system substrate-binding protein